jgi:hypothetical protein
MGEVDPFCLGYQPQQIVLDLVGIVACGQREALSDPPHVGVYENSMVGRRTRKAIREHHVRGLARDAGQAHQVGHPSRHRAAEPFHELGAAPSDGFGFLAKEPRRPQDALEVGRMCSRERLRIGIPREQLRRDAIHHFVCALRGQDRRDEKLERPLMVKASPGVEREALEQRQNSMDTAPRVSRFVT